MQVEIFDKNLEKIGIIDDFTSLIWHKRFYEPSECELYIEATENNLNLLKADYYLRRTDDDSVMIIDEITIKGDSINGDYMTVKGTSLESILKRRIVMEPLRSFNNQPVEKIIRTLLIEAIINPDNSLRKISNFKLMPEKGYADKTSCQFTGDNLLDIVVNLCKTFGYGWKITIGNDKCFWFDLYKYTDRSINQKLYPQIIFSDEYDNLTESTFYMSNKNLINSVTVNGWDKEDKRMRVTHGRGMPENPLYRYEAYVDVREKETEEMEPYEYFDSLVQKSNEVFVKFTESFDSEVILDNQYEYKKDFFLGDRVSIYKWGMVISPQIIEIIEKEDQNGYSIVPIFAQ